MNPIISTCIGVLLALFIFVVLFWIVVAIVYGVKKSANAQRGPDEYHKNIKSFRRLIHGYGREQTKISKNTHRSHGNVHSKPA